MPFHLQGVPPILSVQTQISQGWNLCGKTEALCLDVPGCAWLIPEFFWGLRHRRFVLPLIMGFVRQLPGLTFTSVADGKTVSATLTLIARRSAQRAGTRQWRRGADTEGQSCSQAGSNVELTMRRVGALTRRRQEAAR